MRYQLKIKGERLKVKGAIVLSIFIFQFSILFTGCREYHPSDDPSLRLSFSTDTLCFDTVITEQGSATLQLKVYNRNASALVIKRIWLEDGEAFTINIDGEADIARMTNMTIYGGDSLFVFVRVTNFGPMNEDTPVRFEDILHFHLASGVTQDVLLEAYGQNVTRIGKAGCGRTEIPGDLTLTATKPYLLFDTIIVGGKLTIEPGATLFMHRGACIFALSDVDALGTLDAPIIIRGDRLDHLFDSVPYLYAGGAWDGIYLQSENPCAYRFSYVDILSGKIGLYCLSTCIAPLPTLRMDGCRIHNHALYGLVLSNIDALITNTEISNCASYCVYCSGGTHVFVHSTIASYFGFTNIRIQSVAKEDAAAVYIDNLSKTEPFTTTSFINSIITGYLPNQLVVATPFDQYYPGSFIGNYLKTDSLVIPHAAANVYYHSTDTAKVFVNDFYKYKEYIYYDFHLDSISPAIGIGDSIAALPYPMDRDGFSRADLIPDAGCYQHQP